MQFSCTVLGRLKIAHVVLLRRDGSAVACRGNRSGQYNIPPLDEGISFIQVSAGGYHTVLLRSDGSAVAFGDKSLEQCNIPPLVEGMTYTQVSACMGHTVLLRSDGWAVVCADYYSSQFDFPPWDKGKFLPAPVIWCFSKVTAVQLRAERIVQDNATFLPWRREWHTLRCPQAAVIQCFSVVVAVQLLVGKRILDNATFHL